MKRILIGLVIISIIIILESCGTADGKLEAIDIPPELQEQFQEYSTTYRVWKTRGDSQVIITLGTVYSTVNITFCRMVDKMYLSLGSTHQYGSIPNYFVGSIKYKENSVIVDLLGVNSSSALFQAIGGACSHIPLPEVSGPFDLRLRYGSKEDVYKIELVNDEYKYAPLKGAFTEIGDYLDENNGDGIAKNWGNEIRLAPFSFHHPINPRGPSPKTFGVRMSPMPVRVNGLTYHISHSLTVPTGAAQLGCTSGSRSGSTWVDSFGKWGSC